jgi:hypothetical protein
VQASAQEKPRSPEESQIKLTFSRLSRIASNYRSSSKPKKKEIEKREKKMSFQMLLARASFYLFTLGLLLPVFLHFGAGRQTTQKWPSRNQSPTIIIIRIVYLV